LTPCREASLGSLAGGARQGCRTPHFALRGRVPVPPSNRQALLSASCALALVATACQRDEVSHFHVEKVAVPAAAAEPVGTMPAHRSAAAPPGMSGDVPPPPAPEHGLRWTLPRGWKDQTTGGMRYATLTPDVAGRIDGSVVVLPGPAGGELANVNRWRNQIGLAPLDEGALGANQSVKKTKAGEVHLFDFTSEGTKKSRVIAGLLTADGSTWFVKLTGDAEAVKAAQPAFLQLIGSLRLE
jgi:hypothetical protein